MNRQRKKLTVAEYVERESAKVVAAVDARADRNETDIADGLLRAFLNHPPGHEPDIGLVWLCGNCPYSNVGTMCTKCGAPRHDGTYIGGRAVL